MFDNKLRIRLYTDLCQRAFFPCVEAALNQVSFSSFAEHLGHSLSGKWQRSSLKHSECSSVYSHSFPLSVLDCAAASALRAASSNFIKIEVASDGSSGRGILNPHSGQ